MIQWLKMKEPISAKVEMDLMLVRKEAENCYRVFTILSHLIKEGRQFFAATIFDEKSPPNFVLFHSLNDALESLMLLAVSGEITGFIDHDIPESYPYSEH